MHRLPQELLCGRCKNKDSGGAEMDTIKYWLWLHTREGLSSIKANNLLTRFHSITDIYNATNYDTLDGIKLEKRAISSLMDKSLDEVFKI